MSVKTIQPRRPKRYEMLLDELVAEWRRATPGTVEPVIVEQINPPGNTVSVYGVWSDWSDLDRTDRGDIIMDAAKRVKTEDTLNAITQAWGLTPAEADRFGIAWKD